LNRKGREGRKEKSKCREKHQKYSYCFWLYLASFAVKDLDAGLFSFAVKELAFELITKP
jgi:hypothetical protein